jgi:hypothetical protein
MLIILAFVSVSAGIFYLVNTNKNEIRVLVYHSMKMVVGVAPDVHSAIDGRCLLDEPQCKSGLNGGKGDVSLPDVNHPPATGVPLHGIRCVVKFY